MIEKLGIQRGTIFILMIISFLLSFLGTKDAINSTLLHNELILKNGIDFGIVDKYNKKSTGFFPDLHFKGTVSSEVGFIEIKVSKGEYDRHKAGQNIRIYKTNSNEFMTDYEVKNQSMIHVGKNQFSFVFIPTFIFYITGLFCLYKVIRN